MPKIFKPTPAEELSTPQPARLLRRRTVQEMTGLPCSTLYLLISQEKFPRPVQLSARSVAWREHAVAEWIASRPTAGR